jgi:hypothetical protein
LSNLPEEECVFIDETGATLNLTRTYGRAPTDQRVYGEKPIAPGQRISTLGALSSQGLLTALCFEGTLIGVVNFKGLQIGSSAASVQKFTLAHLTQNHDVGEMLAAPLGGDLVACFTHSCPSR